MHKSKTDLIVVGGGHGGVEAAAAAARLGVNTLLLTHNLETIGALSCNPAIGGIGKGHIVSEIEALGGIMSRAADAAAIQGRVLNRRKGPAVQATRVQADRPTYAKCVRKGLDHYDNLYLLQDTVKRLLIENGSCVGVEGQVTGKLTAKAVVLTTGTFLAGRIHIGQTQYDGGRAGDPAAHDLAHNLREIGISFGRLKTGTPPRIDKSSIDASHLETQCGENPRPRFADKVPHADSLPEVPCLITMTTPKTHDIIRDSLYLSPIYSGEISSQGPRYCPSIEDKVVRFADKDSHQIFLEPEGLFSNELYPNGISTGLPYEVQEKIIRSCPGLEGAHITRPGYAIEYDYLDPRGLRKTLESDQIDKLFLAGQINGTTGYEEAAGQGLIAGTNAALLIKGEEGWVPARDEAYIGVMIDDLITTGVTEPYRMFTSRAEHRLRLRSDNADLRLTQQGFEVGLVSQERWYSFKRYKDHMDTTRDWLKRTRLQPDQLSNWQKQILGSGLRRDQSLYEILRRPNISYTDVLKLVGFEVDEQEKAVGKQIEIEAQYEGYVERQEYENQRHQKYADVLIPKGCEYDKLEGLSNEVKEKLRRTQPKTVGEAARIPGVTPAAISRLLVHMRSNGWLRRSNNGDR